MNIEEEFQKMIASAYVDTMLDKGQLNELRLAFLGGAMIGHTGTVIAAFASDDDGDCISRVDEFWNSICIHFKHANENR